MTVQSRAWQVRRNVRASGLVLCCACVLALTGCTYERVVHDSWDGLRKLSEQSDPGDVAQRRAHLKSDEPGWAILLATYQGDQAREQAYQQMHQLRQTEQVPDLWVRHEEGNVLLYRGRYQTKTDTQAQEDLRQSRMLKAGNKRAFSRAAIVPVGRMPEGNSDDALDLHRYSGMYTLQIAFFDEAGGPTFRKAAEQMARELRDSKVEAYYYHGPYLSLVTVGLFNDNDFERKGTTSVYGPRIRQLRETFPYNIGNGATVVEKIDGKNIGTQQSFLVRVP
jgi:hypothetical protein